LRQLRRAAATLAEKAPAEMPRPKLPALPPPQPVPVIRVFALQNIRWRDGRHERRCGKFSDIDLPIPLAEKARGAGLVIDPISDEAKKMRQYGRGGDPAPHECIQIEEARAPSGIEMTLPPGIVELPRGQTRVGVARLGPAPISPSVNDPNYGALP
jgi:hypothetical protein